LLNVFLVISEKILIINGEKIPVNILFIKNNGEQCRFIFGENSGKILMQKMHLKLDNKLYVLNLINKDVDTDYNWDTYTNFQKDIIKISSSGTLKINDETFFLEKHQNIGNCMNFSYSGGKLLISPDDKRQSNLNGIPIFRT
jgi:hypothetical protein